MGRNGKLFAQFDLDYADHPKIAELSDAAFRLHVELILWSRKYLTDGKIPNRVANRLGFAPLSELLNNDGKSPSVFKNDDGSYQLHGYADMNDTKAVVEARVSRNSANGARGGRPKKTQSVNEWFSESVTDSVTDSGAQKKAEKEKEKEETTKVVSLPTKPKNARGCRLPDGWMPKPETVAKISSELPALTDAVFHSEHLKFADYWAGVAGPRGVKLDWDATWRNWMRRVGERLPGSGRVVQSAAEKALSIAEKYREVGQ